MAMDVGGAKGGIKSDINVTPLVDVMLVLLIIMMIVAPMLQQGVVLTLPTAVHTTDKPDTSDQVVVFVDANSKLYVNTMPVLEADVVGRLQTVLEDKKEKTVYLKGDKDAPYGAIMKMMDALRKAQIDTVGLITERPGGNSALGGGGQ
ncbi:MAG TPA: biopolymer transporter ExbD [Vicinamibacterales bacterium]|jgi:biopolymer transport protein ExbD|nr:biopolymer transporter ExbD [Vicinamibacterales bacterium]